MGFPAQTKLQEEWLGVDVDLGISLRDYGFIVQTTMFGDEHFVLYQINDGWYGTGYIGHSQINSLIDGDDWASAKSIDNLLEYGDVTTREDFKNLYIVHQLSLLLSYFGYQNIFGEEYSPIPTERANVIAGLSDDEDDEELSEEYH